MEIKRLIVELEAYVGNFERMLKRFQDYRMNNRDEPVYRQQIHEIRDLQAFKMLRAPLNGKARAPHPRANQRRVFIGHGRAKIGRDSRCLDVLRARRLAKAIMKAG